MIELSYNFKTAAAEEDRKGKKERKVQKKRNQRKTAKQLYSTHTHTHIHTHTHTHTRTHTHTHALTDYRELIHNLIKHQTET